MDQDETADPNAAQGNAPAALSADNYLRLRRIAHQHLRRHRPGQTLNTTSLVHEAWIRLAAGVEDGADYWSLDRDEFLKLASTCMRRLIVDHARRHHADKRGGGAVVVSLEDSHAPAAEQPVLDVIAVDVALREMGSLDPALEKIVECRFFTGLTMQETASVLQRPMRSVERDWARARAYLLGALEQR